MKHRLLSVLLIVAVMASALAGAMTVSVHFAYADEPSSTLIGTNEIKDELIENYPGYYDAISDFFTQYIDLLWDTSGYWCCALNEGNTWLISLYYNNNNGNDWFSYSYTQYSTTRSGISRQQNAGSNGYNGVTMSQYLYAHNNTVSTGVIAGNSALQFTSAHNLGSNLSGGWLCACPTTYNFNVSGRKCYISVPVSLGNGGWSMQPNLVHGSAVNTIDFHWFKFQLGQRWYVTTYDQSLVANMETGDDTFWAWSFDKYLYSQEDPVTEVLTWNDMQYLPAASQFIEQSVTNLSPNGILAFDITNLVLSGDVIQLALSEFWQVLDGPGGMVLGNVMASSEDIISLVLTAEEKNESQNNAWTEINNYTINYPSVTVSPQQLAEQLLGDTAYTGFMGDIRIPYSLGIKFGLFGNDVNLCDAYFHYWLYQTGEGLGADEDSLLNFDLFNACVIAAPQVNRNVYVSNWSSTESNVIDFDYIGLMDTQDLLDSFDLLLVAPAGSEWLKEVDSSILPFSGSSAAYTNLNQESVTTPRGSEGIYPVYIIVSQKAISKSQLYVFCDGFSKLYKLAVDFCDKRDLWDSSFFDWSMSIFWELETVNGHLFSIENEILGWKLSTQFELLFDKLNTLSNNIVDPDLSDVDPWYLPLWNWVNRFAPSVNDFSNSIDVMDDTFDELPAIPQVTDPPVIPTLPGFD